MGTLQRAGIGIVAGLAGMFGLNLGYQEKIQTLQKTSKAKVYAPNGAPATKGKRHHSQKVRANRRKAQSKARR